jgi:hypothetical protein
MPNPKHLKCYIHENPVKALVVAKAEGYLYGFRDYIIRSDLVKISFLS